MNSVSKECAATAKHHLEFQLIGLIPNAWIMFAINFLIVLLRPSLEHAKMACKETQCYNWLWSTEIIDL